MDVPALLELVDVNDDFSAAIVLKSNKTPHSFLFLFAALGRMNFDNLVLKPALEELSRLDIGSQATGVIGVLRHHKNEGLNLRSASYAVIAVKLNCDVIVIVDGILKLVLLQFFGRNRTGIEVLAGRNRRLFDEAVRHRLAQT